MKMEQKRYEFLLEAVQPIAHHSETLGNSALIMRRKVRQPDGSFAQVPCITADTMRHGLREAGSYALLDAAGLLDAPDLSEAALRLLFSGGMITGSSGSAIKLAEWRAMLDCLPHLALLGGCAQNRMIPGRLMVDDAMLLCAEQVPYLSEWTRAQIGDEPLSSQRAYIEEVQRVRMDPSLSPEKRLLLGSGARAEVEGRLLASEAAAASGDAIKSERTKSSMLPRRFERVIQGARFAWSVTATCYSELDVDTLVVLLATFLYEARVGGKRAVGHGRLRAVAACGLDLASPAEQTMAWSPSEAAVAAGQRFRAHVGARKADIVAFLATVNA